MKRYLIAVTVVLAVFVALVLFWPAPGPVRVPLPQPNGYDDFVKAGSLVTNYVGDPKNAADYKKLDLSALRVIVGQNAEALKGMRVGLSRECRVPPYGFPDTNHLKALGACKSLAQAISIEARLAELEGRTNDAARAYLDALRLGQGIGRGGLMLDWLVGTACERIGSEGLARIAGALEAPSCRRAIADLEALTAKRESFEAMIALEQAWIKQHRGLADRVTFGFRRRNDLKATIPKVRGLLQAEAARQEQLCLDLALRAYELEHGKAPAALTELVPDYLKALPPR